MTLSTGTIVAVKDEWPEQDGPVHVRTPHYVRGRHGTVLRHLGDFLDPGDIAFERRPVMRPLYHVAFPLQELWPGRAGPSGTSADELVVEIYGHWLTPSGAPS